MKGVNVLLSIGSDVLAGQRGATLNRSAETMEATSKSSDGNWKENEVSFKEWSVDCDGLVVEDDAAYLALETAYENGDKVSVSVETAAGHTYDGSAIITEFPLEAPYDDLATYSLTLLGDGALTKTDAV